MMLQPLDGQKSSLVIPVSAYTCTTVFSLEFKGETTSSNILSKLSVQYEINNNYIYHM